jgi:hypothetical protein
MDSLPGALAALAASAQFVTWYAYPSASRPGKMDKIPTLWHSGAPCNAHEPGNWTDAATAVATQHLADRGYGAGIGFVFTDADPFFCADVDGAHDGNDWSPLALELVGRFPGAAVEVSHSGRGLHIIGRLTGPPPPHSTKNVALNMELYTSKRFIALTGTHAHGDAGTDCTAAFHAAAASYFPPTAGQGVTAGEWTTGPVAEWGGPEDDETLIARALKASDNSSRAVFGGQGYTFRQLWTADVPHDARSECDQALAGHLAFWTGKDCARIERLMRASPSYRDKWDSPAHANYLATTILKACSYVTNVAVDLRAARASDPDGPGDFVDPSQQLAFFDGCTYILQELEIYDAKRNRLMNREAFDVLFGGRVFVIDAAGEKVSDSAYKCLTQSRVNRPLIVDDLCFRPGLATGEIIREGAWSAVNTYAPYVCVATPGDASRWLRHLALMLPDATDARILIEYLARAVQYPGVKIPWWPVLQGVKGNGKTLIAVVMEYLFGETYTYRPNTAALARDGMKFNKWLSRKLWVTLDELALHDKRGFMEELKPIVTEARVTYEAKGVDPVMGDNTANGIILTNHKDGLPLTDGERRYAVFYCAQQSEADLIRDGMTQAYFDDFLAWLQGGGFAHIAHYLQTYPLPAVLPNRAPKTSATAEAITQGLGTAEQLVQDAIEEGRQGFAGGWVSSHYLDQLLDARRLKIPLNKRRGMMQALGFDWHPCLPDGRVHEPVAPDGRRSKLYVRPGHLSLQLTDPAAIGRAYTAAQTVSAFGAAGSVISINNNR